MRPAPLPDTAPAGFSLLELMVVVAVIAILSMMAVPSFLERTVRRQIEQSMPVADVAKPPLAAAWAASQPWPADNAAAGLPAPDKITGQYVASVTLDGGAIQVVFGNNANARIQGKTLSIRPAVSAGAHVVPIAWVCGRGAVPGSMTVQGVDRTDIDATLLPVGCR